MSARPALRLIEGGRRDWKRVARRLAAAREGRTMTAEEQAAYEAARQETRQEVLGRYLTILQLPQARSRERLANDLAGSDASLDEVKAILAHASPDRPTLISRPRTRAGNPRYRTSLRLLDGAARTPSTHSRAGWAALGVIAFVLDLSGRILCRAGSSAWGRAASEFGTDARSRGALDGGEES